MSTTVTLLTYEGRDGQPLVQLAHKSITLRDVPRGSQKYDETPDWSVEFVGRVGFQHSGGGLPQELSPNRPDAIAAKSLPDAMEALTRIGHALERWLDVRAEQDGILVATIAKAALYGHAPELPLGEVAPKGGLD